MSDFSCVAQVTMKPNTSYNFIRNIIFALKGTAGGVSDNDILSACQDLAAKLDLRNEIKIRVQYLYGGEKMRVRDFLMTMPLEKRYKPSYYTPEKGV